MTQGELEKIPLPLQSQMSALELRIMTDIIRRIKTNGFLTASARWQLTRLQQMGESMDNIQKWIGEALSASEEGLNKIFSEDVYKEYYGHESAYQFAGKNQIPFESNQELQHLIEAVRQQTLGELRNMTGSMGFAIRNPETGRIHYTPLREFYVDTLDSAMLDIHSGAFDYQTVLNRTIQTITNSGVRWINYDSGHHNRIDVAVRRAVMTGFRQIQGKINEQVAAQLHTDYYEVTYHVGARPTHQPWQGRVWTMQELIDVCGLGDVTGLHGANCYHDYRAFPPGTVRTYTDDQLEEMLRKENTPKEYNGKSYTTYEALQQQRRMETAMRKTCQDIKLLQEGDADEQTIMLKKAKYQGQMQAYKAFSEKMGLPEQMKRVYQDGLKGKFMPTTKSKTRILEKPVAKAPSSAIIKSGSLKEVADVHTVGKINREIYKCVTNDIITDDVIITDKQIRHIQERHPDAYERYCGYLGEIVSKPDFIIKSNKPYTALILKEIIEENEVFKTVLRLATSSDNPEYKNSIITFMKIDEKEWKRLLRNKQILYKKE